MEKHYKNLAERVEAAFQSGQKLNICGASSKSFYGGPAQGVPLPVTENRGVVDYDPAELVVVARAGIPLAELNDVLAEKGQMLGFEPPFAAQGATLGGAIASGLAGACRPYRGGVRDYLLGTKIINGKGQILQFGGRVMKNVAGFDLFRPMAGAMGTLGVLLEISLRLIPIPEQQSSFEFHVDMPARAIGLFSEYAMRLSSLSAASWYRGCARIRLSGSQLAVQRDLAIVKKAHDTREADPAYWQATSQFEHAFFQPEKSPTCIAATDVAPATPPLDIPGEQLIDWGGARRYFNTSISIESLREKLTDLNGSASQLRGGDRADYFHPLSPELMAVHHRFKESFDPKGIFNPGRLYAGL